MVDAYFSIFLASTKRYVFPIVNEATFMDVIDKAYANDQGQSPLDVICAKACVLSFTCILVHMEGRLDIQQVVTAKQCAARVNRMMSDILANPCVESLQVCTMMCMYSIFSGNVATAAMYLSVAYRFVSMFGAHLTPSGMASPIWSLEDAYSDSQYLRRVFWHCYMYDKDICLRAGYPPIIDDDHCDLTLPLAYKEIDDFDSFKDGSDLIPGDMRLTIIKSKMIRLLYCAKAFQKNDIQLLQDIRELDEELETWRMSIPTRYRPNLAPSYSIRLESDWNKSKQIHVVVIHFEYYFLLSLIHIASGRCQIRAANHKANITSCQLLALKASRSILGNLAIVSQFFKTGDFW
ncbi:hypothetical protein TruAng_009800 [Truncatella angustata]|nr:hypothetical protein TruAng_009800 [Truncatella angustata]